MEKAWWLRPIFLRRVSRLGSFGIHGVKIPSQTLWHTSKRLWPYRRDDSRWLSGYPPCITKGCLRAQPSWVNQGCGAWRRDFVLDRNRASTGQNTSPQFGRGKQSSKISNLCTECFCHWGGQCVLGPQIGDVWPLCCDARGSYYVITRPLWQCNAPSVPLLQAWIANSPKAGLGHMIVALTIGGVDFRPFCWTLAMFCKTWGIPIGFQSVENFPLGEWCHWWKSETAAHHQHGRMQYCILHDDKTSRDPKTCRKGFSGFKVLLRVF